METVNNQKLLDSYVHRRGLSRLFSGEPPRFFLLHYLPGELLTNPFSPSQYLQFVVDGDVLLYDMPDEESTVTLQTTYHDVTLLGDIELLDAKFTPFFVEAKTEVYTLAFFLEQYRQQLLNDPVFLLFLCRGLANKLNGAVASNRNVPLRQRVRTSLQYAEVGDRISGVAHLARTLNVSSRQLMRVLKEYCEQGVLEHTEKGVYLVVKKVGMPAVPAGKDKENRK